MSMQFPGFREGAKDQTWIVFNSPTDLTPTGVKGNALVNGGGNIVVNYSGVGNPVVVTLPLNYEAAQREFSVYDTFGGAGGNNIIVTGLNSETFNGASTYTISTAYGSASFANWSGVQWIKK